MTNTTLLQPQFIRDIPVQSNDDDGKSFLKKHSHSRTEDVGDDDDDDEDLVLPRKKKVKTNSLETDSSLDKSCFVDNVTPSNLLSDTLYLPQRFTSSNGLTRKCRKIVLIDGGERSWILDLRFDESSGAFYIPRGWRSFCSENGRKVGSSFMFKLVGNGETPVLCFCSKESVDSRRLRDCSEASNEEEDTEGEWSEEDEYSVSESLMETEKKMKYSQKRRVLSYSSYSPCHKRFLTFTLPPYYATLGKLSLPKPFLKDNGINKPGETYLLGKDGTKWLTSLRKDKKGIMSLGKGWKEFVKGNGLDSGFTLKLIWEDTTPAFSLCCCAESTSDREQEEYFKAIKKQSLFMDSCFKHEISRDENNKEERDKNHLSGRDSAPSRSQKQLVTLTITLYSFTKCRLHLSKSFTRENGINKPGMITLSGRDGIKHQTALLLDRVKGSMALGNGWKDFARANGLKIGDSFTLELVWEDTTPVLCLCPAECNSDRGARREYSETNRKRSLPTELSSCKRTRKDIEENNIEETSKEENNLEDSSLCGREKNHVRCIDSTSTNRFMTITIRPGNRMRLPKQFVEENSMMNKPGVIYLLGSDGTKWVTNLVQERDGRMNLGNGWKPFAEANGLKPGESCTLESILEDETPTLRLLLRTEPNISKPNEKESVSDTEGRERDSFSSAIQDQFVTLTLTPEDVRDRKLILPSQFMKANGMNKLGKIALLGENKKELSAILLTRYGFVALDDGWDEFCESNGVKIGESFT